MIIWLLVIVIGGFGWISNMVQLCYCDFKTPYKAEVLRAIGIFVAPMGAVEGFMKINDDPNK